MLRTIILPATGLLFCWPPLKAHTPLFDCFDSDDETITCEGGYSDGASAAGTPVRILDEQGKVLAQDQLDVAGSVSFMRPAQRFMAVFDAGEGHVITVFGEDIY